MAVSKITHPYGIAHGLWALLLCLAGSIFISGFICALAVDAEDEISISGTRSWNRVLSQSRLVGTALKIDLLFFAVLIFWLIVLKISVAVCTTMGVISAQSAASLTISHTMSGLHSLLSHFRLHSERAILGYASLLSETGGIRTALGKGDLGFSGSGGSSLWG